MLNYLYFHIRFLLRTDMVQPKHHPNTSILFALRVLVTHTIYIRRNTNVEQSNKFITSESLSIESNCNVQHNMRATCVGIMVCKHILKCIQKGMCFCFAIANQSSHIFLCAPSTRRWKWKEINFLIHMLSLSIGHIIDKSGYRKKGAGGPHFLRLAVYRFLFTNTN